MTPIQLTDLIAYEHRLTYERQRQQSERPFRTSFLEIRRMLPIEEVLLGPEAIEDIWKRHVRKRHP